MNAALKTKGIIASMIIVAIAVGAAVTGCAMSPQSKDITSSQQADASAQARLTLAEWGAKYPEVYGDYLRTNYRGVENDTWVRNWSHSATKANEYAALAYGGNYDFMNWASCIACKSTAFNDIYDELGDDAFMGVLGTAIIANRESAIFASHSPAR